MTPAALAEKYDLRVPRYTSYPTAPHFHDGIDDARVREWLGELDPDQPISLYVHIPFCDSLCWFCGCHTKVVRRREPIARYLDLLAHEIDLVANALPGRFPVQHLHWGGGSPTMLTPADWSELTARLRARFDVTPDAELAVEIDPRDATRDYVAALAASGVNRVSIGVQDFDARVQAAINRDQPYEVVSRVCEWLRAEGITAINLDLMYGLPHQTEAGVALMVDRALTLKPSRIALFGYAHVPWMKAHQRLIDERALPDAPERFRQAIAAAERLTRAGWVPIGLDHFARPDDQLAIAAGRRRLRRNFQGYTTDEASVLLGLGASAIGALPQGYAQNAPDLGGYRQRVSAGQIPVARGVALAPDDLLRRSIIEAIMCDLAVDAGEIARAHGRAESELTDAFVRLEPLVKDGLAVIEGARVAATKAGRPFVRLIAAAFDAYLHEGRARHSRAV